MALLVSATQSTPAMAVSKNVVPGGLEGKQRQAVMQAEKEVLRPSACSFVIGADTRRKVSVGSATRLG